MYPLQNVQFVHVALRRVHTLTDGDKLFLGHGQKGTVQERRAQVDMPTVVGGPFQGMTPDLIINTAALVRNTSGLLLEMLVGQGKALRPDLVDTYHTTFLTTTRFDTKLRIVHEVLRASGYASNGRFAMMDGRTGELMQATVFMGPVYTRILKHMAEDKLRTRDRGRVNMMTRQATAGGCAICLRPCA